MLAGIVEDYSLDQFARNGGIVRLAYMAGVAKFTMAGVTCMVGAAGLAMARVTGVLGNAGANIDQFDDHATGMLNHLVQVSRAFGTCWMSSLY